MKVLFVCTGNRFRSLGAEAFANAKKPEIEVFSRGTDPSQNILEQVKEELRLRGVEKTAVYKPEKIKENDIEQADLVIAMTDRHVDYIQENFDTDTEVVNWEIPDVDANLPEEELREKISETYDIIERKVEDL